MQNKKRKKTYNLKGLLFRPAVLFIYVSFSVNLSSSHRILGYQLYCLY